MVHGYSGIVVELHTIVKAMRVVENRWQQLERYVSGLLVQDLSDPKKYCALLFDDETFSRSRLYFWLTGFITEIQPYLTDNIDQWKLYQQGRIRTQSMPEATAKMIEEYIMEGKKIEESLWSLHQSFSSIRTNVQALSDAVSITAVLLSTSLLIKIYHC